MFKNFLLWLPMPVIAIVNAVIRQLLFVKPYGEKTAHQLSTGTIIIFLGIYIYFILDHWKPESFTQAVWTGILWITLTVLFEFGLGFANKRSFNEMLQAYNILNGDLWILVPLFMLAAPIIFYILIQK